MTTSNARSSEAASVPNGWHATTIGDVADIFSGATPSTEVASYWDGEIPWCIPTDITGTPGKYLLTTERNITHEGLVSSGASLLPEGSLLLCSRATIGDVKIAATTICTNQGFKSLVCKDGVSNEFLYYLIQPFKPRMVELATGSTFRELSKRDLGNITVALPPLPEQRAIAAVLSDIDGMLDALDALIAKKQDIKKATMQQLLTGKTRLPGFSGEWETKRLGDFHVVFQRLADISKSDLSPDGEKRCIHYGELFTWYNESIAEVLNGIDRAQKELFVYSGFINDVLMPSSDVTPNGLATASCLQIDGVILGGDILVIRVPDQIVEWGVPSV